MSPKSRRRLVDFIVTAALTAPVYHSAWWAGLLATTLGVWSYYDGLTRGYLSEERQ